MKKIDKLIWWMFGAICGMGISYLLFQLALYNNGLK